MTVRTANANAHVAATMPVERPECIRVAKRGEGQPDTGWAGGFQG
jgi:hypothetical protein